MVSRVPGHDSPAQVWTSSLCLSLIITVKHCWKGYEGPVEMSVFSNTHSHRPASAVMCWVHNYCECDSCWVYHDWLWMDNRSILHDKRGMSAPCFAATFLITFIDYEILMRTFKRFFLSNLLRIISVYCPIILFSVGFAYFPAFRETGNAKRWPSSLRQVFERRLPRLLTHVCHQ